MALKLTRAQRRKIRDFAARESAGNDDMHRMPHLRQTARVALFLARSEGADPDVCWAAAMLHDIRKSHPGDHGALGGKAAAAFLVSLGLPADFAKRVRDAIHHHNKGFRKGPVERQVLWDADKLPILRPAGFMARMLPYWAAKLGAEEGRRRSAGEYLFYFRRVHTRTARRIARRSRNAALKMILRLENPPRPRASL